MTEDLHQLIQRTLHFKSAGVIPGFTGRLMVAEEYEAASQKVFVELALKNAQLREKALALGEPVPDWMRVLNTPRGK